MRKASCMHWWTGFLFLALMTACSEEDNPENEADSQPESHEEDTGPEETTEGSRAPLTGMPAEDEPEPRAFGVMLGNSSSARPQTGLHEADVVYEVLAEAGITRLLAFYHSSLPEQIGPVRSAREYYIDLNNGYDAVFISAGGSPDALSMMESEETDAVSALHFEGTYFQRSGEREAPFNMYTSWEDLEAAAEELGYAEERLPEPLMFSEEMPGALPEAGEITISYGGSANEMEFFYGQEEGYVRSAGGEEMQDPLTGEKTAPKNVLIAEASHEVVDDAGRREIALEDGGPAYLFQEGYVRELEWENREGRILPVQAGEVVPFLPGKTWISIVPEDLEEYVSFE